MGIEAKDRARACPGRAPARLSTGFDRRRGRDTEKVPAAQSHNQIVASFRKPRLPTWLAEARDWSDIFARGPWYQKWKPMVAVMVRGLT
jgi:hypothetical protein